MGIGRSHTWARVGTVGPRSAGWPRGSRLRPVHRSGGPGPRPGDALGPRGGLTGLCGPGNGIRAGGRARRRRAGAGVRADAHVPRPLRARRPGVESLPDRPPGRGRGGAGAGPGVAQLRRRLHRGGRRAMRPGPRGRLPATRPGRGAWPRPGSRASSRSWLSGSASRPSGSGCSAGSRRRVWTRPPCASTAPSSGRWSPAPATAPASRATTPATRSTRHWTTRRSALGRGLAATGPVPRRPDGRVRCCRATRRGARAGGAAQDDGGRTPGVVVPPGHCESAEISPESGYGAAIRRDA